MNMFHLILVHLTGSRARTLFLGLALMLGVTTVITTVSLVRAMRLELGNDLDLFGPNIVILPRYESETLASLSGTAGRAADLQPLKPVDLAAIYTIEDRESLNIISPKLVGPVGIEGQPALLVGMEAGQEFRMKSWLAFQEVSAAIPEGIAVRPYEVELSEGDLILGAALAQRLGLSAGDETLLEGRAFQVTGILKAFGGEEDQLIFMDLPVAQELLGYSEAYSMIEVSGFCNNCPIEDMTFQIGEVLPHAKVTALRQAALVRGETIDRFQTFGILFSGAALIMTVLSAVTTMLSAVNERTREIGTLRAIGFRQYRIIQLIFFEAVLVSLGAGLAGYGAGILIARLAGPRLAAITVPVPFDPGLILPALGLSVILVSLAAIYPARKAARMDPVRSIQHF